MGHSTNYHTRAPDLEHPLMLHVILQQEFTAL